MKGSIGSTNWPECSSCIKTWIQVKCFFLANYSSWLCIIATRNTGSSGHHNYEYSKALTWQISWPCHWKFELETSQWVTCSLWSNSYWFLKFYKGFSSFWFYEGFTKFISNFLQIWLCPKKFWKISTIYALLCNFCVGVFNIDFISKIIEHICVNQHCSSKAMVGKPNPAKNSRFDFDLSRLMEDLLKSNFEFLKVKGNLCVTTFSKFFFKFAKFFTNVLR